MPHPVLITHALDNTSLAEKMTDNVSIDERLALGIVLGKPEAPTKRAIRESLLSGYHLQGLPFQMGISSYYATYDEHASEVERHKQKLELLLNQCLFQLITKEDKEAAIEQLIEQLQMATSGISVRLSLSFIYEKEERLFVCGASLGRVGYVLDSKKEGSKQLGSANYHIEEKRIPFKRSQEEVDDNTFVGLLKRHSFWEEDESDNECLKTETIEIALENSFHESVDRGDEIICYPQSIPRAYLKRREMIKTQGSGDYAFDLKRAHYDLNISALEKSEAKEEHTLSHRLTHELENTTGSAFVIGKMVVPERKKQNTLKKSVLSCIKKGNGVDLNQVKLATEAYLEWMNENASSRRIVDCRFNHLYHGASGRVRAQRILNMINEDKAYFDIMLALEKAIQASSATKHAYSRYLYDYLLKSDCEPAFVNSNERFDLTKRAMRQVLFT